MTHTYDPVSSRRLQVLKKNLYFMSGFILAAGLLTGIGLIAGASRMVANFILPLQIMAGEIIANLVSPMFSGILINTGVVILILALVLSLMFYALGRMVGHIARLEERLAELESRISGP